MPLKADFYQMIQHLPGFVLIEGQDANECDYLNIQLLKKGAVFNYENADTVLKGLMYVMPWASYVVNHIQF